MINIDGSYGEGGGQVLRTALALSLVTGKPFCIENIRAKRRKPGLMRQHLTAVNAAVEIGNARAEGNEIRSTSLTFKPEQIKNGKYHFAIGSAGSCTLVLQSILPALMVAKGPSEIVLEGGTHNPMAPPFDFLEKAFLPLLERMGVQVSISLEKHGFYPAGGGRFKVLVNPADRLEKIELLSRGKLIGIKARALTSQIPEKIAHRELKIVMDYFNLDKTCIQAKTVKDSPGPGNVITIEVESENMREVFTGFGERGVKAEKVAKKAANRARQYIESKAVAGKYLADQLLIPMAIAGGGRFTTLSPTEHTRTNAEVIGKFLKVDITMDEVEEGLWEIKLFNNE
ncbi:MAG: RNA 3'-terminal phosphate cyclase [Deltaproteobacteria bacterium]|nr:RNA 3'-terminal phosphate cyclase [Deltaproteobacteria bacterium]